MGMMSPVDYENTAVTEPEAA
ncbi:hypothetical protein ACWPN4_27260 [Gordonia polyisoprenivorans]